jgi:CubicO group peptidase (beta-lactamase class C family)
MRRSPGCSGPTPRPCSRSVHSELREAVDALAAENGFSGAVRVDRGDEVELVAAYGLAHRGLEVPNTVETQFAIASGTKGFTAATVVSLIEESVLGLSTTARSVLGQDLPLIRDDVTVEQLLSHRSGIGDYLDEELDVDLDDYLMPVPVHELATTEQYLAVLDGHATKFEPGERFAYCNSGYVALALIAERTSGTPFHELVVRRVCEPAGMKDTEFLRSDELPGKAALGYLIVDGAARTNVFHLPVRGSGDGGIYTTLADVSSFWRAFFAGRIVSSDWVAGMTRPHSESYGLGFWLGESDRTVRLEGSDAGVAFYSVHDLGQPLTYTVISNTSDGAWRPIARLLNKRLGGGSPT